MRGTRNYLRDGLTYFYPQWRVIERPRERRLDIYVHGKINSTQLAELDLIRPLGCEFRFYSMNFFQSLFFGRTSWTVKK